MAMPRPLAEERDLGYDELHWLRELCAEGPLTAWPPEHIIEALLARGLIVRRFGAIGVTDRGRAAAAVR